MNFISIPESKQKIHQNNSGNGIKQSYEQNKN